MRLVVTPAPFTLTETLGAKFTATSSSASAGGTISGAGTGVLGLAGTFTSPSDQTFTLNYRATRDGSNLFSVTNEVVSTTGPLAVTGGTGTVTPPATASVDVLPCGTSLLAPPVGCTGASCNVGGTTGGGLQYTLNAGTPPPGTTLFVLGLGAAPPAGACPGFDLNTNGVQFDIRPLTTPGQFEVVIPKAALGTKSWKQADVCLGTNLKFVTKSSDESDDDEHGPPHYATLVPGVGGVPGRWWGLLPSKPKTVTITGLGVVGGPYITSRSKNANGDAVVDFTMPYVPGSEPFTTDGKAAFDPMCYGG